VFIPKCRRKKLYGKIRKFLGPVFHEMAKQKGCKIEEGHMVQNHVHMLIKIPPKFSVAEIIGYIKGKSAIAVARQFGGRKRNFNGEKLWARGYAVSTVGFEEEQVRKHYCYQEQLYTVGYDEEEKEKDVVTNKFGKFCNYTYGVVYNFEAHRFA